MDFILIANSIRISYSNFSVFTLIMNTHVHYLVVLCLVSNIQLQFFFFF